MTLFYLIGNYRYSASILNSLFPRKANENSVSLGNILSSLTKTFIGSSGYKGSLFLNVVHNIQHSKSKSARVFSVRSLDFVIIHLILQVSQASGEAKALQNFRIINTDLASVFVNQDGCCCPIIGIVCLTYKKNQTMLLLYLVRTNTSAL